MNRDVGTRKSVNLRRAHTLDESNPERVSFSEYARAIGRGEKVVREYANGFVVRTTKLEAAATAREAPAA